MTLPLSCRGLSGFLLLVIANSNVQAETMRCGSRIIDGRLVEIRSRPE